jgi:hypothetical protein
MSLSVLEWLLVAHLSVHSPRPSRPYHTPVSKMPLSEANTFFGVQLLITYTMNFKTTYSAM